ncbi:hypothetical protein H2201_001780 [Coniosporium apollinis]|uniref:Cyclin domain-containing protein n=2 Tax=Coniosporium TaxID=2810619 RepID=A0ABQ9P327_9PEZI|nr:hypothetical protein H2199_000414 [Cladosporium sp. JES 115]KAJ9667975.1 hypothetical protein H2201_001780 [Coniosporium apollinis]
MSILVNPLATVDQISQSGSQLDGVPADLENSIRFAGARLTQAAGILLRLPQDIIAQAIVIFTRFFVGPEGGSLKEYGAKDVSAGSLYLMAKLSSTPRSPRSVLNVYAYLDSFPSTFVDASEFDKEKDPESYYLTEGTYRARRTLLLKTEALILRVLGFQTHVALPYTLCINYLQTLDVFSHPESQDLAKRAFAQLNTLLLSPQLVYLTHQPYDLATAAIYLAAREVGVKLPDEEWWEVFDTDREELGFLVVAMRSMEGFAAEEKRKWGKRKVPLTVEEVEGELERRSLLNGEG